MIKKIAAAVLWLLIFGRAFVVVPAGAPAGEYIGAMLAGAVAATAITWLLYRGPSKIRSWRAARTDA